MLAEERFSLIMEQLNRKRTVTVQELCEALSTSESTIRRDLTELDRLGKLNKVHGGATLPDSRFLADEPTSALDVTTQAQIVRQMMELRDDFHTGIIIVTHNIGVAAYMADQLIVMQNGKVVDQGTRDEVMNHPTSDYTKKLLAAVPEMEGRRFV